MDIFPSRLKVLTGTAQPIHNLLNRAAFPLLLGLLAAAYLLALVNLAPEGPDAGLMDIAYLLAWDLSATTLLKIIVATGTTCFFYYFFTATELSVLNRGWMNAAALLAVCGMALSAGIYYSIWTVMVILLLVVMVLGMNKMLHPAARSVPLSANLGSSRFGDSHDELVEKGLVNDPGLILGQEWNSDDEAAYVSADAEQHILTIAPTGSGKGSGLVIPNLYRYRGPTVVLDIKGENFIRSVHQREKLDTEIFLVDPFGEIEGQVKRKLGFISEALKIDPINRKELLKAQDFYIGLQAKVSEDGAYNKGINPMDLLTNLFEARNYDAIYDEAGVVAGSIVMKSQNDKDTHWDEKSIALVRCGVLLLYFCDLFEDHGRDLRSVRNIVLEIFQDEMAKDQVFQVCRDKAYWAHDYLKDIPAELNLVAKDEQGSILSNFLRHTNFISSPFGSRTLSKPSIDLSDLKTKSKTIYLVIPPDKLDDYSRLARLWINTIIQSVIKNPETPNDRVLVILDEISQMGFMPILTQLVSLMRGYGITTWLFFQDVSQMKSTYGDRWQTFAANCAITQVFNVTDQETAAYVSAKLGTTTIVTESYTSNEADDGKGIYRRVNKTHTAAARALMLPEEVRTFTEQLILKSGHQPTRARKLKYFIDGDLKAKFPPPYDLPIKYRHI